MSTFLGIAIAGGSCSGKTTLAEALAHRLNATLVRVDDYYRPLDHLTYEERCTHNFDHPDAIDSELMIRDLRSLLTGATIEGPLYDFAHHTRFGHTKTVVPQPFVILEGIFSLCYPEVATLCPVRIFVDAPAEVCLQRRIARDMVERERTEEEVRGRFQRDVWPMYCEHIAPSAARANLRVCGTTCPIEGADRVSRLLLSPEFGAAGGETPRDPI